jgi:hypothetical protein
MENMKYGFMPAHPGEVLKDGVEYCSLSQSALSISTTMMFEAAVGIPVDALMRLHLRYTMQVAQKDKNLLSCLAGICKMAVML